MFAKIHVRYHQGLQFVVPEINRILFVCRTCVRCDALQNIRQCCIAYLAVVDGHVLNQAILISLDILKIVPNCHALLNANISIR